MSDPLGLFVKHGPAWGTLIYAMTAGLVAFVGRYVLRAEKRKKELAEEKEKALEKQANTRAIEMLISKASGLPPQQLTLEAIAELLSTGHHDFRTMQTFIRSAPPPYMVWIKERMAPGVFVMIQVNANFANVFLGQAPEFYYRKTDREVWPADIAKTFAENDEAAVVTRVAQNVVEHVASPLTGAVGTFTGVKWALTANGRTYACGLGTFTPD